MSNIFKFIKAFETNDTTKTHEAQYVSATDFGSGKRGLDTFQRGGISHVVALAELLIKGTSPEVNFDRIAKTETSSTSFTLEFSYLDQVQYYMDVTDAFGDYAIEFRAATGGLTLETGFDLLLLESGDKLLLE